MTFGGSLYIYFRKEYNEVEGMVKNPEARPRKKSLHLECEIRDPSLPNDDQQPRA
jgi:hypothetical protein